MADADSLGKLLPPLRFELETICMVQTGMLLSLGNHNTYTSHPVL